MNNNKLSIIKTIVFIACALPAGLAVADVSSDRVDTYKSNKLLPSEVQIATINSVSSESTGVVVFSMDTLSWKSYNNVSDAFISKYMDWTKEDFEAFFANSANNSEFEYAWKFLSQTGNDHLQGATISDEDALALLQNQFNTLVNQYRFALFPAFPCEGLDFTGLMLVGTDFSNCSGITGNQLASAMIISTCTFKDVDFNGADISGINAMRLDISACTGLTAEQLSSVKSICSWALPAMDFTNANLTGINAAEADFSKCTGLTADQLMATSDFWGAKLPAVDFTGIDLSGRNVVNVDFSNCTGLTGEQLASTLSFEGADLPAVDFTSVDLTGKNVEHVDFSKCTGLTGTQLASTSSFRFAKLPAMDFTNSDFSGLDISYVDFSQCTGLTGEQLAKASNINNISLTSTQYEAMKTSLPSGKYIYVDNIRTKIP